jgi:hypothetical protein
VIFARSLLPPTQNFRKLELVIKSKIASLLFCNNACTSRIH